MQARQDKKVFICTGLWIKNKNGHHWEGGIELGQWAVNAHLWKSDNKEQVETEKGLWWTLTWIEKRAMETSNGLYHSRDVDCYWTQNLRYECSLWKMYGCIHRNTFDSIILNVSMLIHHWWWIWNRFLDLFPRMHKSLSSLPLLWHENHLNLFFLQLKHFSWWEAKQSGLN